MPRCFCFQEAIGYHLPLTPLCAAVSFCRLQSTACSFFPGASLLLTPPASLSITHSHKYTETTMTSEKPAEGKPAGVSLPGGERFLFPSFSVCTKSIGP